MNNRIGNEVIALLRGSIKPYPNGADARALLRAGFDTGDMVSLFWPFRHEADVWNVLPSDRSR